MNLAPCLAALSFAIAAFSADATEASPASSGEFWRVIPERSTITYDVESTLHDFKGTADVKSGAFCLTPGDEHGFVAADATSMKTGNDDRDRTMHDEIMASASYPMVRFDIERIVQRDGATWAEGSWTMHGVSRSLAMPVTLLPGSEGIPPRLTSTFTVDFRQWNVPVPRMLVVRVDPKVEVHVDLALVAEQAIEVPRSTIPDLKGVELPDQLGALHRLDGGEGPRLAVIFDQRSPRTGEKWRKDLAGKLPANQVPLYILDGAGIDPGKREDLTKRLVRLANGIEVLFDWDGVVRERLRLPRRDVLVVALSADGKVLGLVEEPWNEDKRQKALRLVEESSVGNVEGADTGKDR